MDELLVVGNIPEFRDKEPGWFRRNQKNIEHGTHLNSLWGRFSFTLKPSDNSGMRKLIERLVDFGYEMNTWPEHKGEFSLRGGSVILSPINESELIRIEFFGNTIESIERAPTEDKLAQKKRDQHELFEYLHDGDFVVHELHGIGIWRGVIKDRGQEYFYIEYRGPRVGNADTLMVPISERKRITPYIGFRVPQVTRLGTPMWKTHIKKTKEDAVAFARKLLTTHASRQLQTRAPVEVTPEVEDEIANDFPFEETNGQRHALVEIMNDLESEHPMDRILLGDVGFGKTEVALRASVRVAASGKQVAILSPTTLLAEQHFATWTKRLERSALNVVRMSRLEDKEQIKKNLLAIKEGGADIIIGTHRILSKDIVWKNLGLLVVDEEQRFGVKAKEHIKELKKDIDILTLSATPLPRTFSLALANVKKMSKLDEAPEGRIAPETFVLPFNEKMIKSAVERELERDGQMYVLESRIYRIPKTLEMLRRMLPNRKIGYLHGRMSEKQLVETMKKFREGNIEILISTTIIENGIDLKSVNTLIVTDSNMFGLADLHQLRGRVGRGSLRSYAYFFYDPRKLTLKAENRLDTLSATQFLGSGTVIAEKDLEMRGAGNILGREQSGAAGRVGLNLYSQFLAEAVEKLRENEK
ncbi:MAG: helicase-related protein [bacterium]|nr:helicase-related protein [bacterium]